MRRANRIGRVMLGVAGMAASCAVGATEPGVDPILQPPSGTTAAQPPAPGAPGGEFTGRTFAGQTVAGALQAGTISLSASKGWAWTEEPERASGAGEPGKGGTLCAPPFPINVTSPNSDSRCLPRSRADAAS